MILFQILFLMISLMFLPAAIYGAFQQIKFSQLHVKPTSWVAKYGSKPSRSEIDCAAKCKNTMSCTAFRHIRETQTCQLGSQSELQEALQTDPDATKIYVFGAAKESWHMIISGISTKVELYNYENGQQCFLPDMPNPNYNGNAAWLNDTAIACVGGAAYQSNCTIFDQASNTWIKGPYRLNAAEYPSNVVVPSKGWFIYGGYFSNYQNNAQHLSSISSQWSLGPLLYLSQQDYGQCIVQLFDDMTLFFGGNNGNSRILTYNWTSQVYTSVTPQLTRNRLFSACAVYKGTIGETLAAVAGGNGQANSVGMESWNPMTKEVKIVTPILPFEVPSGSAFAHMRMQSIKEGSALLLYNDQNNIWKYTVANNSWNIVAKTLMLHQVPLIIKATKLSCP